MKPWRIVMHWTAGGNKANDTDLSHYHEIVESDGTRVLGKLRPEANEPTADGIYAAHTRGFNTRAIGLAMAGMAGAVERPFDSGNSPITTDQVAAFAEAVAEYAETYNIDITRENVLTHAEVQITHGIVQAGKWDITWLPEMKKPGDALKVGDKLREMARAAHKKNFALTSEVAASPSARRVEELLAELASMFKSENA